MLWGLYRLPEFRDSIEWRLDKAAGIARGWLHSEETLPTPVGASPLMFTPTVAAIMTATPVAPAIETPTLFPTPIPDQIMLTAPEWEKQDWNNCGPATLVLGLRYYGWLGDQFDISDLQKPDRGDKNVNIEELIYYVRNYAGWLQADYRVGGDFDLLKRFIAAGYPVIIEKGYIITDGSGGWAGHYLLLTGYDDDRRVFIVQDTYTGPDREVSYKEIDEGWITFNRVFLYIYLPERQGDIDRLLGENADSDANRKRTLEETRNEIEANPENAFAWFNLGSNLVYFERYAEAADAFDKALLIGLPWRFTRYQFGPYIAYFNTERFEDVIDLADATLYRTSKSEESQLWRGWAKFRLGDRFGAIEDFRRALEIRPNYFDALYALEYLGASP